MNVSKKILYGALIAIAAVLVGFYIYSDIRKISAGGNTNRVVSQNPVDVNIASSTGNGYSVSVVDDGTKKPEQKAPKAPNLSLPVTNHANLDGAFFNAVVANMKTLTESLSKDSTLEMSWLQLAVYRKMLGDYQAAADILTYVTLLWPTDFRPYSSLGDIYQFYLKNYPLAEKAWLAVIALKPDEIEAYQNLSVLYGTSYTEKKAQTLPILVKGFGSNPHSVDLMLAIARYFKANDSNTDARTYYDKAIAEANLRNNQELATSLRAEAEAVR